MPSMVLLMRSRLRIRPRSFSMRMPSRSVYWRLILRLPASSLGRSASSSASSVRSSKLPYLSFLEALAVFLVRAIARTPPLPDRDLAEPANVTGVLLADDIEALASEAGELGHLAVPTAFGAKVLVLNLSGILFCGLCFFLSH